PGAPPLPGARRAHRAARAHQAAATDRPAPARHRRARAARRAEGLGHRSDDDRAAEDQLMSSASISRQRSSADIVAVARRSLIGVRGVSSTGTGWVVLSNGLVLTSHEAVGYQFEVFLELESGRRCEGRVIWADVARDLALVLPSEH